jgi:predicted translin family RNA/ssDNA-binding protein
MMTSEFYPPNDPLEKARWKVIKIGDAVYSLKNVFPKLAAKLEKKLEQARQELKEAERGQEQAQEQQRIGAGLTSGMTGFVYLIRAENGLYKIGKAKNISKRLQPFSVSFPMKWELVYSFQAKDYTYTEQLLHSKYHSKRDVGEWFRLTTEDVEYIKGIRDGQL